jgi:hypothetical protein
VIPSLWTILGDITLNIAPELINALVYIPFIITSRYIYLASMPASQACRGGDLFIRDFFLASLPDSLFFGCVLVF